jgi:hypothetical protein
MDLDCLAEARGLKFHRAVAAILQREPAIVAKGRERVRQWKTEGSVHVIPRLGQHRRGRRDHRHREPGHPRAVSRRAGRDPRVHGSRRVPEPPRAIRPHRRQHRRGIAVPRGVRIYAQGVGEKTAIFPKGRGERLDRIRTEKPQRRLRARRGLVGTAARWGHARDPRKPLVTASPSRYITCHE